MSDFGSEVLAQGLGGNTVPPTPLKSRSFTLTLWNEETVQKLLETDPSYIVYGKEIAPTTGKEHWQCYVHYKVQKHLTAMHKKFKGHDVQIAYGSAEQNRTYIIGPYSKNGKEKPFNPDAVEAGELPRPGTRSDIHSLDKEIKEGKRGRELSHTNLEVRAKYCRFEEKLVREDDKIKALEMYKSGIFPEVHIRYGPPGTGKTRHIWDLHGGENIYEMYLDQGTKGSIWWDGYEGESIIIINEFTGQFTWEFLLKLTDLYPVRLQIKGGHTYRLCTHIYFTSNIHPKDWYYGNDWRAFERRITSIVEVK